jgi:hypothetical protein
VQRPVKDTMSTDSSPAGARFGRSSSGAEPTLPALAVGDVPFSVMCDGLRAMRSLRPRHGEGRRESAPSATRRALTPRRLTSLLRGAEEMEVMQTRTLERSRIGSRALAIGAVRLSASIVMATTVVNTSLQRLCSLNETPLSCCAFSLQTWIPNTPFST